MNDLLDRLFDLPLRQRVLLLGSAFAGLLLLYFTYFYWPLSSTISEKRQKIANLTASRDQKVRMVANIDEMRRTVAELNAALKKATAQLPDSKEIPDLLSNISSLGRESGLDILVFRQNPEQFRDFYAEVPVEIRVLGSYHQVGAFFDKVGRLNRIVNVGSIGMKKKKIEGDVVIIDTSCGVTTYRFLEEEERDRVAGKGKKEEKK